MCLCMFSQQLCHEKDATQAKYFKRSTAGFSFPRLVALLRSESAWMFTHSWEVGEQMDSCLSRENKRGGKCKQLRPGF